MNIPTIDDAEPLTLPDLIDRMDQLTEQRDHVYQFYIAPLDDALRLVRAEVRRLSNPHLFCAQCGAECNIGTKCPTFKCPNYSGIPF